MSEMMKMRRSYLVPLKKNLNPKSLNLEEIDKNGDRFQFSPFCNSSEIYSTEEQCITNCSTCASLVWPSG